MIPQDTIEQIRQASDIVDIIGQYLRVKKRGRNFLALCPFHTEKTPSFSISQDKQIYHCFGCGKGGNVFTFLMEHESMTFIEAAKFLALKAGITIREERTDDRTKELYERLHYAHQVALDYFKETLFSDRYRNQIFRYLKDKRNISDESIEHFQLGLSGEEWDGFLKYAQKKDLFPAELEKAGLVVLSEKKGTYFDRFRQRLMIPIFNLSGKPIAFGGRALKKGEPAKYVNSPETQLYSKSTVLYGLNFTKQFIRESNEVIIVEGYFDLISLYQAGVKNVVASSGTAFTCQQARLLARFAETAYLFFDADSAGQTAAVRSVDALYDAGLEVLVMVPPEGEDPDSVAVKAGLAGIEELKNKARRYIRYRLDRFDLQKAGIIAKEKVIKELSEVASRIQDDTRRQLLVNEAADLLQVNADIFKLNLHRPETKQGTAQSGRQPKKIIDIERDLIALIIQHPDYIDLAKNTLHHDDFQSEEMKKIYSLMLTLLNSRQAISESSLIDMIEDKEMVSDITRLGSMEFPEGSPEVIIGDHVRSLMNFKRERTIDRLKGELKVAEEQGDKDRMHDLEAEILSLIKRRGD